MNWKSLFDELGKCTAKRLFTSEDDANYSQVRILTEYETDISPSILYFSDWETFSNCDLPGPVSVMLYSETVADIRAVLKKTFNSAVFYSKDEYLSFYRECCRIFEEEHRLEREIRALSDLAFRNDDLFTAANRIAEIYGHPVNIIDTSYSVIAFSTNIQYDIEDLKNDDFRLGGYISPEIIHSLDMQNAGVPAYGNTTMITHLNGEFRHFRTPIFMNNVCIAYFSVYYLPGEEPSPLEVRYLPGISKTISLLMQMRDYNTLNKENYYNSLFASLLTDKSMFGRDWEARITAYGYHLKEIRYIFVADVSLSGNDQHVLRDFSITLHHIIPNSIYAVVNHQIIFLSSFNKNEHSLDEIVSRCASLTESHANIRIGVSSRFFRLTDIRTCTDQAADAIETGSLSGSRKHVFLYDDLRLTSMAAKLSRDYDFGLFTLAGLYELLEYDRAHDSELLHTVYAAATHKGGVAEVCEHLHIHRNTLYFRLSKAAELTGLDYQDPAVSAAILFTVIYMKLNRQIDFEL